MKNYKGFNICFYQIKGNGYFADGYNDEGSVIYGFGATEEESFQDLKGNVDEYIEMYGGYV